MKWSVAPLVDIPEEEQKNYPVENGEGFHTKRYDMDNQEIFDEFLFALSKANDLAGQGADFKWEIKAEKQVLDALKGGEDKIKKVLKLKDQIDKKSTTENSEISDMVVMKAWSKALRTDMANHLLGMLDQTKLLAEITEIEQSKDMYDATAILIDAHKDDLSAMAPEMKERFRKDETNHESRLGQLRKLKKTFLKVETIL